MLSCSDACSIISNVWRIFLRTRSCEESLSIADLEHAWLLLCHVACAYRSMKAHSDPKVVVSWQLMAGCDIRKRCHARVQVDPAASTSGPPRPAALAKAGLESRSSHFGPMDWYTSDSTSAREFNVSGQACQASCHATSCSTLQSRCWKLHSVTSPKLRRRSWRMTGWKTWQSSSSCNLSFPQPDTHRKGHCEVFGSGMSSPFRSRSEAIRGNH